MSGQTQVRISAALYKMRDLLYFRTSIPPEVGDTVGWAVAAAFIEHLRKANIDTQNPTAWWDGVRFPCSLQGRSFMIELTPYFEAKPLEWSIQLCRTGVLKFFSLFWHKPQNQLCSTLDELLSGDERFTAIEWCSMANLAKKQKEKRRRGH